MSEPQPTEEGTLFGRLGIVCGEPPSEKPVRPKGKWSSWNEWLAYFCYRGFAVSETGQGNVIVAFAFSHDPDPLGIHMECVALTPEKCREMATKLIAAADAERLANAEQVNIHDGPSMAESRFRMSSDGTMSEIEIRDEADQALPPDMTEMDKTDQPKRV